MVWAGSMAGITNDYHLALVIERHGVRARVEDGPAVQLWLEQIDDLLYRCTEFLVVLVDVLFL